MIVVQTPLRISFCGGGTDFEEFYSKEEGAVLSSAINLSVYIIIKERFDNKVYVNYSRKEIVDNIDNLEHDLVREAMRLTGVNSGVEITTLADVTSEGSGLGSSSSFTVGMLHALYAYKGELRAIGDVLRDQLSHMRQCGFDSFAVREDKSAEDALKGLAGMSVLYGRSVIEPRPLFRRR